MSEQTTTIAASASQSGGEEQQSQQTTQTQSSSSDFHTFIGKDGKFAEKWTDNLPDSHKSYAGTLGKFPGVLELAGSYAELEKKAGQKIQPPGPDAKPEEWDKWRSVVGAPKTAQEYGLKAPEKLPEGVTWDQAAADKLAAVAHKHALPPAAVKEILGLSQEMQTANVAAAKAKIEGYVAEQRGILEKEWGDKFKSNLEQAVKAASKLGVDINDPDIGNNAKMLKVLHNASLLMMPDQMPSGGGTSASVAEQIAQIRNSDAYQGKLGADAQAEAGKRIALLSGQKV